MWLVLVIVKGFGLQLWFIQNTDLLFWFGLEFLAQKRKTNCYNNSIWTEPLDSLFLLISVNVWHKNLLNRKYEQNLCLWEFFFLFICLLRETKKFALESFFFWLQKCGKSRDVTVVLQPRCILPFCVTHKSLVLFFGWRTTTQNRRDFEKEGRNFPQLPKIKTHEAEEDGDLSVELGKWLEDSVVFRHFAFDWETVKAQEWLLQW